MATKRIKRRTRRRSCKHGKLKRPVRTKKGGKRKCKKSKKKNRKRRIKHRMKSAMKKAGQKSNKGNIKLSPDFTKSRESNRGMAQRMGTRFIGYIMYEIGITSINRLGMSEEDIKTKLRDNGMNFIRILERKLSWNNIEQRHKPNAGTQTKIYVMFTNEIMLDKLAKRIKRELVKISEKSSNKRVGETDEQFEMRKNKRIERAFNKVINGRKNDLSAFDRLYDYIYSKMNGQEKIEVDDYEMVTFVQELMGNTPLIVGMKPVLNNTYNPGDEKATFTLIADPLIKRVGETDEQFEMRKNNPDEFLEEGEFPNLQTIRRRRNESVAEFARRKKHFSEFIDYEE